MRDQADKLRLKMLQNQNKLGKSIAVVSGKGGVGKSNFSTNFAINLAKLGKKVVIFDMDIGMGNVNILIGNNPQYNLNDYLSQHVSLQDVMYEGPYGLQYISGGSGLSSIVEWSESMFDRLISAFSYLQMSYDFILFDMGAGATNWSLDLLSSIEEIIVISTAEPTSITDAYSMMKYIHLRDQNKTFYLLCNRSYSKEEGKETVERLKNTMLKFLSKEVKILGTLPEDPCVRKAVREQTPFSIAYPNAPISKNLHEIVVRFVQEEIKDEIPAHQQSNSFLSKLKSIFSKGRV